MSIFCGRSLLFTTATQGVPRSFSVRSRSASSSSCELSNTASTSCAVRIRPYARSTPMLSTGSSVRRIPAVSARRSGIPPKMTVSSTTSRVVPAYWVTMERSHPARRFISVDFPAFGRPAITVSTPSRRARPASNPRSRDSRSVFADVSKVFNSFGVTCGISSSG